MIMKQVTLYLMNVLVDVTSIIITMNMRNVTNIIITMNMMKTVLVDVMTSFSFFVSH